MQRISWETFEEQYRPIANHLDSNASLDGTMFETYGDEEAFVSAQPPDRVWTYVDVDDGDPVLMSGLHHVNRLGYVITDAYATVPTVVTEEDAP